MFSNPNFRHVFKLGNISLLITFHLNMALINAKLCSYKSINNFEFFALNNVYRTKKSNLKILNITKATSFIFKFHYV